jgi:tRNA-dihydrouridine synthase B
MLIGSIHLKNNLFLAPMAGVTDRPFRQLCKNFGAGLTVSEMVSSNPKLRNHYRTQLKSNHSGETEPRVVQILGTDPEQMAAAACYNADQGAQIIDINMGCPAKKVCAVAAGSALLRNESLVGKILDAVVNAVDLPVTLKIRTGWDIENRNALKISKIAEESGIAALTIHGRTRACRFSGNAEYDTIKKIKSQSLIPIIANGDINSVQKAKAVLDYTQADAIMIGRAAQGRPWIFTEINHYLNHGELLPPIPLAKKQITLQHHLETLYRFYGDKMGVQIARKHINWYFNSIGLIPSPLKHKINQALIPTEQMHWVNHAFKLFNE